MISPLYAAHTFYGALLGIDTAISADLTEDLEALKVPSNSRNMLVACVSAT